MATSYVWVEQLTVKQFCLEPGMTPFDTLNYVKLDEYHLNVSQALVYKILLRFCEGIAAAERMGRLPLRNSEKLLEPTLFFNLYTKLP